jgi:hypothetical protein
MSFCHLFCAGFAPGIDQLYPVGPTVSMQGMHIKIAYKSATKHGYFLSLHHFCEFIRVCF